MLTISILYGNMILETIITNLTRNLDVLCQQDGKSISSHEKLKDEALKCLENIIENAPASEYDSLIQSENHEILLGYLLSILCQLAKNDKSRSIRLRALGTISSLIERLELIHARQTSSKDRCSIKTLILALPGVSSTLFKISSSDTRLPRMILVKSIRTLAKFISVTFTSCDHCLTSYMLGDTDPKLVGSNLIETCANLAPRIGFLIDYVATNCDDLHDEVKCEMLDFCLTMVTKTKVELLTRTLMPIVRYLAFISSTIEVYGSLSKNMQLKLMLLTDSLRMNMQDCAGQSNRLDSMALDCILKLLDELEESCLQILVSERQAKLAMLSGLFELTTQDIMMAFIEMPGRRDQFLKIMFQLVEFSAQQPFLFLTDTRIEAAALERRGDKIYTIEKRFIHLTDREIVHVNTCCQVLGHQSEWSFLCDILNCDLMQFSSANNLYVTLQVLRGCLLRDVEQFRTTRLTSQLIECYAENIQANCVKINEGDNSENYSNIILKTVIAIETVTVIVELHVKFVIEDEKKVVILRDLLCPLLNWCSSSSRAVSEAALNSLTLIGRLYGHETSKPFIEQHIDYIVNGAVRMLDNFLLNPEVTEVLAITFKLSSMETFYYFRDVFERVFKVLSKYHHTKKSKSIVLFFLRTLNILNSWLDVKDSDMGGHEDRPLESERSIKSVMKSLNIDMRIAKVRRDMEEADEMDRLMKDVTVTGQADEQAVQRQIETGKIDMKSFDEQGPEASEEKEIKVKPNEVILTEKILRHCLGLMSSNHLETKTLAIKTAACGLKLLRNHEDTLLPLIHLIWPPLVNRLTEDYSRNLEVNLCAFECLISMAIYSKDFIRRRTLDAIIPRLCLFLESQARQSMGKKSYGPYCMTIAYKCQLKILTHMGQLAYHTEIAYSNLWRIVCVILKYVDSGQIPSLREAALNSLHYLIALDADCVWFYAKQSKHLASLPFGLVFEAF